MVKINAVKILRDKMLCTVAGVGQSSGSVNEQPIGVTETMQGSINRAISAWRSDHTGNLYFGIESGIIPIIGAFALNSSNLFEGNWTESIEDASYFIDVPIVSVWIPSIGVLASKVGSSCEFPKEAVMRTSLLDGGFRLNTVGKTLAADGTVMNHADPHQGLIGVARQSIIEKTILDLMHSELINSWIRGNS